MTPERAAGSHRDPGGFLFWRDEVLYRQVNKSSEDAFSLLTNSGLYESLVAQSKLVEHEVVSSSLAVNEEAHCVIQPRLLETISYPYEWSFSQLKDAALLTLDLQKEAISKGMSLKDATAYNVQFSGLSPVFIDTLSFDRYEEGKPWVAYGQFCRHFLAPLALMSMVDVGLNELFRTNIDGVPLSLATKMLPWKAKLNPGLAMHIGMHARAEAKVHESRGVQGAGGANFSRNAFLGLLDSLTSTVQKLNWKPGGTEWFDYYEANNNYSEAGLQEKERLVESFLSELAPSRVWDLGGNTGRFSRIATGLGAHTVCFDIDPGCVESNYLHAKANGEKDLLPLLMDLGNPSPSIGWDSSERMSLTERGPADVVMALGLIHHLTIGINVPFELVAKMFSELAPHLIIEFVPRGDSQIDKLLATRNDVFVDYHEEIFREKFCEYYSIIKAEPISGTKRTLYAMQVNS
jgi:ribosomal protein L11 methylase PrmA